MHAGFCHRYARLLLSCRTIGRGTVHETTNDIGPATSESGQTATEYTAVLLLVAIVAATALTLLNDPFDGLVSKVVTKLTDLV